MITLLRRTYVSVAKDVKTMYLVMTKNNGVYILELWDKFCCYREFLCTNSRSLTNFTLSTRMYQKENILAYIIVCLLYTSPSPRDKRQSRMPSSA